jgi:hypothetical protein
MNQAKSPDRDGESRPGRKRKISDSSYVKDVGLALLILADTGFPEQSWGARWARSVVEERAGRGVTP